MIEVGRVCVKIAGRDAGLKCVVVDVLGKNTVLIDGQTRRRKCNMAHLEPLAQTLKIERGASHEKVVSAFKEIDVAIVERKSKPAISHHRAKTSAKPVPKAEKAPVVKKPAVKKAPAKAEVKAV
jgi:large subunit ribosomal protein L14e